MARKKMLDNPYGVQQKYWVVKVKGGDRTHIYSKQTGGGLCGAGLHREGKSPIKGALVRSGKKVDRKEVDCLRCIKILKLDPGLTGSPTTVEYDADDRPQLSRTPELIVRQFRPSAKGKRKEHVMVVGGRAGAYIGRRAPKDDVRFDTDEMQRLIDRRGYEMEEITEFGPHQVDGDLHNFRRGDLDRYGKPHPTQTALTRYPWFRRSIPGVVEAPGRRFVAAERANPKRDAYGRFVKKAKKKGSR